MSFVKCSPKMSRALSSLWPPATIGTSSHQEGCPIQRQSTEQAFPARHFVSPHWARFYRLPPATSVEHAYPRSCFADAQASSYYAFPHPRELHRRRRLHRTVEILHDFLTHLMCGRRPHCNAFTGFPPGPLAMREVAQLLASEMPVCVEHSVDRLPLIVCEPVSIAGKHFGSCGEVPTVLVV